MKKFIVAEKLHMSQIFNKDGKVVPVTILKASPVKVTQVKGEDTKDKYSAVQVGFGSKKSQNKAMAGHLKGMKNYARLVEFRIAGDSKYEKGQEIKVDTFEVGDFVKVTSQMKGRGFAGAIKRHGFHGQPASHGHDHQRAVGSIGMRFPQHVRKGLRMAGRMGGTRTVKNLEVVDIDVKKHLIAVKGAVPGAPGAMVKIESN
jgi:large subunit ribosomal protein L3